MFVLFEYLLNHEALLARCTCFDTYIRNLFSYLSSSITSCLHRHTFLEMCQYRQYQFDTLRRAKHSSLMLLYHLHFPNAINTRPLCALCNVCMRDVRWHCDTCIDFDICDSCYHEGVDERDGSALTGEGEAEDDDDNNSRSVSNHATGKRGNETFDSFDVFSTSPYHIPD